MYVISTLSTSDMHNFYHCGYTHTLLCTCVSYNIVKVVIAASCIEKSPMTYVAIYVISVLKILSIGKCQ